jgi:exonuclease VII small subunit
MNVLGELEDKLDEAKSRVIDVTEQLKGLANMEQALESTTGSLNGASVELKELVGAISRTASTLDASLEAFKEATSILQLSDPASVVSEIRNVDAQVVTVQGALKREAVGLSKRMSEGADSLGSQITKTEENVKSALGVSQKHLIEVIEEQGLAEQKMGRRLLARVSAFGSVALFGIFVIIGVQIYMLTSAS